MTCKCSADPMKTLATWPAWWRGAAATRRQFQAEALAAGHKAEADIHARMASEYERRAENPPKAAPVLINLRGMG